MNNPEQPKTPTEDSVEKILQLAGPRPEIDATLKADIKSAVRNQWQHAVVAQRQRQRQQRRWRRSVGVAMAVAAAFALMMVGLTVWQPFGGPALDRVASLVQQEGEVSHLRIMDDAWDGQTLLAGETLATGGSEPKASRAVLELLDGTTIKLDQRSRIRLVAPGVFDLEQGRIYVATSETISESSSSVEIRTPLGVARDIGTRFEVTYEPNDRHLSIRVRQGEVALEEKEQVHTAVAGEELVLEDGTLRSIPMDPFGKSWAWTLEIFEDYETSGSTLDEFLRWASTEAGWELRYTEDNLGNEARKNILGSSMKGMTIPEALDSFLMASSLQSRLDHGVLWIEEKN